MGEYGGMCVSGRGGSQCACVQAGDTREQIATKQRELRIEDGRRVKVTSQVRRKSKTLIQVHCPFGRFAVFQVFLRSFSRGHNHLFYKFTT